MGSIEANTGVLHWTLFTSVEPAYTVLEYIDRILTPVSHEITGHDEHRCPTCQTLYGRVSRPGCLYDTSCYSEYTEAIGVEKKEGSEIMIGPCVTL